MRKNCVCQVFNVRDWMEVEKKTTKPTKTLFFCFVFVLKALAKM